MQRVGSKNPLYIIEYTMDLPAEGLLGAARLAPAGPPSKTTAFNFAWRRSCRTHFFSVGGSNGGRQTVETWRGFAKFLRGFAG
jgi:hypothetical protein